MDTTMENINNIVNEDTVNIAVEAVEAIPAKGIKLGKAGAIGATVAIIVGGIAVGVRHVTRKKQLKAEQEKAAATGVDNVQVAKDDFEETEDSANEK